MSKEEKRAYQKQYRLKNREKLLAQKKQYYIDNREKVLKAVSANQKKQKLENPEKEMWYSALKRAEKAGINFDISVEDVVIPEICPILGTELKINTGNPKKNSPSLDRIDNEKGYVKGNVSVISYKANSLKTNMTIAQITNLYKYVSNS